MRTKQQISSLDASFERWRVAISAMKPNERRFSEWLFLNAATVLIGGKAGELLSVDPGEFFLEERQISVFLGRLVAFGDYQFKILCKSNGLTKFIIYNEARVQAVLNEAPFCVMGAELGYSYPLRVENFLDEVRHRWLESGVLPHEIGVALGYPLDDVFGYMGLLPLQCKGVCGWQVYGCLETSQGLSCAYSEARCRALVLLSG